MSKTTRERLENLKKKVQEERNKIASGTFQGGSSLDGFTLRPMAFKADHGKDRYLSFAGANRPHNLLSCFNSALYVRNAVSEDALSYFTWDQAIYVRCCAYEKDRSNFIAGGGMNGEIAVFNALGQETAEGIEFDEPKMVFAPEFNSPVSEVAFFDETALVATCSSGEVTVCNVTTGSVEHTFAGHPSDAECCDAERLSKNLFITGACDKRVKVWDRSTISNSALPVEIYDTNDEVTSVRFMPFGSGNSFIVGDEDGFVSLFDQRSHQAIKEMKNGKVSSSVKCLESSTSGRLIFAGTEAGAILVYDTLATVLTPLQVKKDDEGSQNLMRSVTSLATQSGGYALASASLDGITRIWA
eukprot:augustus_masked-scaffold_15-processed-gene-4.11-mRNA-1 protein AED:1.00 eAED:1.00 QI:0/-1/0/0/-1/1/1/0/356